MSCLHQRTKSPAGMSALAQHRVQAVAAGPAVGGPGEAEVRLAQADALAGASLSSASSRPQIRTISPSASLHAAAGQPRRDGVVGAAATRRPAPRRTAASSAGARPSQTPGAQALGGQQVQLAVEPGQPPAGRR